METGEEMQNQREYVKQQEKMKNQRNSNNNANNLRVAANLASASPDPYVGGVAKAVVAADKITGGKATELAGKAMNIANKLDGPKGKMIQALSNKLAEGKALNAANTVMNMKKGNPSSSKPQKSSPPPSSKTVQQSSTEETSGQGFANFELSIDAIKKILIYSVPVFVVVIFCCLFISSMQVFTTSISLGTADSLSSQEVEDEINETGFDDEDELNEERTDDDVAYDIYITDEKIKKFKDGKLNNNIIQIAKEVTYIERKYNEASLKIIEDFYPGVTKIENGETRNTAYDFYYKMYNLYVTYRDDYDVFIDLPLLMATLNLQNSDKSIIFNSNLSDADRQETRRKLPIEEFDYYYDWSSYKISKNNSEHDMEILTQNMFSSQVKEKCLDSSGKQVSENILKDSQIGSQVLVCKEGETYQTEELGLVKDNDKYKEFLKEFLEKKYYLEGEQTIESDLPDEETSDPNVGDVHVQKPASGNFKNWTQCKQSWSSIKVPKSSETMCQIGCLITSVTMQIARSGTAIVTDYIDPGVAVKKYNFANGGNFYWNSAKNIAPNFIYLNSLKLTGMNKQSIANKLTSYDPNRYYMILSVSKKNRNQVHHYVALDYVDKTTNDIYIMDPSSTSYTKLYDLYKVYGAYIYEKRD